MYEAEMVLAAVVFIHPDVPCWGIVGHRFYVAFKMQWIMNSEMFPA